MNYKVEKKFIMGSTIIMGSSICSNVGSQHLALVCDLVYDRVNNIEWRGEWHRYLVHVSFISVVAGGSYDYQVIFTKRQVERA
jgi:hypothetical protein